MQILANVVELWVFSQAEASPRYLVIEASQEKADAFFGGHRFWQIPGTSVAENDEATVAALRRGLAEFGLTASALWAVEYVSTIFNRRFDAMQIVPTFAAEVLGLPEPNLDAFEYGAFEWADAQRVENLLPFRTHQESFIQLRRYITECSEPLGVFRMD